MFRTIIIDADEHASGCLLVMLEKNCRQAIDLGGCFTSVDEAVKGIESIQPQLIFLDTSINGQTGFDLLQQLPEKSFEVIFTSSGEKDARQACQFSPIDYLVKPIHSKELIRAVERVTAKRTMDILSRKFDRLLGNIEQLKQYTPPKKIMVPTINGFELLPVIDILRCQSDINYTTIIMKDKQKLVVAKTLKEFEEMLGEYNFFRIHNTHLVNLAYVKSYNKGKGGSVKMTDNSEIEVSTRRKEGFLRKLAAS